MNSKPFTVFSLCLCASAVTSAQDTDIRELKLKDWQPKTMMVTKVTKVAKAKYPAIDVHNHLGDGPQWLGKERVDAHLKVMDDTGVRTVVNLDGNWQGNLSYTLDALDNAHPGRFLTFVLLDFGGIDDEGW